MPKSVLMMKCPEGHDLPNRTKRGECTPLYCVGAKEDKKKAKRSEKKTQMKEAKSAFEVKRELAVLNAQERLMVQIAAQEESLPDGASALLVNEGKLEAYGKASNALGHHKARLSFIKDLPAADADEVTINNWADKRASQLLPLAVAEKEYMLRFGDDDQREKASDAVLRMNGRYQKEGAVSGGASIILNIGGPDGGGMQLPYMPKRLSPTVLKPEPEDAETSDA